MDLLTRATRAYLGAACLLALALGGGVAGCSLTLDPDDLVAERQDTLFGDVDTAGPADVADSADSADSAADSLSPADTRDTAAPPDTGLPDTAADTAGADTKQLVLHASGDGGCTLDYYPMALTSCPTVCPASSQSWAIVVDASQSTGYASFRWKFGVTQNFSIDPQATGPRVGVKLEPPSCDLFGTAIGPARILVELSLDGGPYEIVKTIDFAVRSAPGCGNGAGNCPAP